MMMILTLSFATGATALAPENGWIFIAAMRFIVGLGVGGLAAVDLPLLQEFVPASKRGWVSGLSIGLLPLGPCPAALTGRSANTIEVGLMPANVSVWPCRLAPCEFMTNSDGTMSTFTDDLPGGEPPRDRPRLPPCVITRPDVRRVIGGPPLGMHTVEGCAGWPAQSLMHGMGQMDDITYVGLDVHKATVCVAIAEGGRGGEVRQVGVFENRPDILCKLAARLGKGNRRLSFCYEAGPCGYGLQRLLTSRGHDCIVVAPSLIPMKF